MRIVAAELPRHRDHLAVALVVSLVLALAGAFAIVMLPAPRENVRYLEAARMIRTRALDERERRLAFAPIALPVSQPKPKALRTNAHARAMQPSDDDLIGDGFDDGLDREDDRFRELSRERFRQEQEELERRWAASDAPELEPHALRDVVGADFAGADLSPLPLAPLPRKERGPPRAPQAAQAVEEREPEFICRLPDRDAVRAWFEDKVRPVLSECMQQQMPSGGPEMRGSVTLSFDKKGRVKRAEVENVGDVFASCAQPKLEELAHPDAFELTFTWPFVLQH